MNNCAARFLDTRGAKKTQYERNRKYEQLAHFKLGKRYR